jgi:hypothetical protein
MTAPGCRLAYGLLMGAGHVDADLFELRAALRTGLVEGLLEQVAKTER